MVDDNVFYALFISRLNS